VALKNALNQPQSRTGSKAEAAPELVALVLAYRDAKQKVDALPEDAYLHGGIDRLTSAIAERDGAAFQLFAFAEQLGQVDKSQNLQGLSVDKPQGRVDNAMLQVDKPAENSDLVDSELVTTAQQSQWLPMESAPKDESTPFLVLVPVDGIEKPVAIQVSNFQGDMYPDHLGGTIDFDDRVLTAMSWTPLRSLLIAASNGDGNGGKS